MLVDIKHRIRERGIASILADCLYEPSESTFIALADLYADGNLRMMGYELDGKIVGCAGVDLSNPEEAVLLHIAVGPAYRGRGVGREMIKEIMRQFQIICIEAETDDDAVGFYRSCGFEITNLGEKYPGCIRYRCVKSKEIGVE